MLGLQRWSCKRTVRAAKRQKQQTSEQALKTRSLRRQLAKQQAQFRRVGMMQAKQAHHIDKIQKWLQSDGLKGYARLGQLERLVKEGMSQHTELKSQVTACHRAQELLHSLSAVITDLRTQLQVPQDCVWSCKSMQHGMEACLRSSVGHSAHIIRFCSFQGIFTLDDSCRLLRLHVARLQTIQTVALFHVASLRKLQELFQS